MPSRWNDRFDEAIKASTFEQILVLLEQIEPPEDENAQAELDRLIQVIQYSKSTLDTFVKLFITDDLFALLGSITNSSNSILACITDYNNNKNISLLANANTYADQILTYLRQFQLFQSSDSAHQFSGIIRESSLQVDKKREVTAKVIQDLQAQYSQELEKITKNYDETIELLKGQQVQWIENLTVLKQNFEIALKQNGSEIANLISNAKTAFSTQADGIDLQQKEFFTKLNNQEVSRENEYSSATKKMQDEGNALIDKMKETSEAILCDMEAKHQQAAHLLGVSANTAQTAHYERYANRESKMALLFRGGSILLMLATGILVLVFIFSIKNAQTEWYFTLIKIITATIFFVPAGYLAKESTSHSNLEKHYRQRQLELATFDPFLDTLEPDALNTIKTNLSDKLFGQCDSVPYEKEAELPIGTTYRTLTDIVMALIKKVN